MWSLIKSQFKHNPKKYLLSLQPSFHYEFFIGKDAVLARKTDLYQHLFLRQT